MYNISAYSHGLMGYQTPNIDQVAAEGAIFTDFYAEQSCTAGRSSFITGQIPFRTGLSKVGMPGAKQGLSDKDPTLAELLKNQGYISGQLTIKRMETFEDETLKDSLDFIDRAVKADKPFFVWHNSTRFLQSEHLL